MLKLVQSKSIGECWQPIQRRWLLVEAPYFIWPWAVPEENRLVGFSLTTPVMLPFPQHCALSGLMCTQHAWAISRGIVSGQLCKYASQADALIDVYCHCSKGRKEMRRAGREGTKAWSASVQESREAYWNGYRPAG